MLGVPYISLDALFWLPNWAETPREELRAKVQTAIDQSDRGWVVDGNYTARIGSLVQDEATDIICKAFSSSFCLERSLECRCYNLFSLCFVGLDPPLALYCPRLCVRTLGRLFGYTPPCSPGCPEQWSRVLSRESIIWWCLTRHGFVRKREGPLLELDGVHVGGKRRRIGGWGKELAEWKEGVRGMLAQQQL